MEIRNLEHIDFDTLFRAFERAFADYEIRFEKDEVRSMLTRRGFDARLSFAVFDNDEIVAFTFNGIGMYNGLTTAYDTGTGTAKEYRGQNLAGRIFMHALPRLKDAGIKQYLLEVMQSNEKALSVYRRMQFAVTRELDCFRQSTRMIDNRHANMDCEIKPIGVERVRECLCWCDFEPSWQNSIESIERGIADLTCLGAYIDGVMAGYSVSDSHTGDLTQIAVSPACRRQGVASRLLREAVSQMRTDFVKVLNIDACNTALPAFLTSKNIPHAGGQYEMIMPL